MFAIEIRQNTRMFIYFFYKLKSYILIFDLN